MSIILCPPCDEEPWPTLGPQVCGFIEDHLCHGPGDLLGRAVNLTDEDRAWFYRMYEVEPPVLESRRGGIISRSANPRAGKRRFSRCALSLRKGSAKTEKAAWIAAVELHPDGPVRCDGFESARGEPRPVARGVTDPYIPMIAYTVEQSEELAYGALRRILMEVPLGNAFDIGLERIMRVGGDGRAEAVAGSPNARDGARTTFQHADETHRFTLASLKRAWTVMLANMSKRPLAEPWALETTTAPEPGGGSVAENTMEYARTVLRERPVGGSRLFFFHREADQSIDISGTEGLKAAIVDASGPYIAAWTDVDGIAAAFQEPGADRKYLERVWLNRLVQSTGGAFDVRRWHELERRGYQVARGAGITIGFDGGRFDDATALVAVEIETGYMWPLGIWERPAHLPDWEIPEVEVDGIVADAFERYHVYRMYCDPPMWETNVGKWAGQYGEKRVVKWWTNRRKPMAYAIRAFAGAMTTGEMSHAGDAQLTDHIGNSRQLATALFDEEEKPLWILRKERPDSPKKIDAAMAGILAWEGRTDALTAGEGAPKRPSRYETKGVRFIQPGGR